MMLFLQFSLEQENLDIWIAALKGIFDLLLLYGLEYFDILENGNDNTVNRSEKSRTKLFTDTDTEISLSSIRRSETERGNCNFIKILAGLLDNAVSIYFTYADIHSSQIIQYSIFLLKI